MFIAMDIKMLHIKIMVDAIFTGENLRIDRNMSDKLEKVLENFYKQVNKEKENRQNLNAFTCSYYDNFQRFSQKIWNLYPRRVKLSLDELKEEREKLIADIRECQFIVTQADWLVEKVEQIKK